MLAALFFLSAGFAPERLDAAVDGIIIEVDGALMASGTGGGVPRIEHGRVLVPLRAVTEYLDGKILWNPDTQQIIGFRGARGFDLVVGAAAAYLSDGRVYRLDLPAMIIEGRTYVPLRFVAEALGLGVEWDEPAGTVRISTHIPDVNKEIEELTKPLLLQVSTDKSRGSGFFTTTAGELITTAGLIEAAAWIRVKTGDGVEYSATPLVVDRKSNLAKLKINRLPGEVFFVFRYYDDGEGLSAGEAVFAVGSLWPEGLSLAAGELQAITGEDGRFPGIDVYPIRIEAGAGIAAAYEGGPLVKENGALIGVVCRTQAGEAYAIPIEYAFRMQNR